MSRKKKVSRPGKAGEARPRSRQSGASRDRKGADGVYPDPVDDALDDSFPASDPPAWAGGRARSEGVEDNPDVRPQDQAGEPTDRPQFRTLDRDEGEAIIARNHIGRIAYARGHSIDIISVYYAYSDGWIYGRMRRSRKKAMLGWYGWWPVAFQVDEVEDLFHWRTVLVHGGFYALAADGAEWERDARRKAIDLLQSVIPQTFRSDDPMPSHTGIFEIAVQHITGSEALPGSES